MLCTLTDSSDLDCPIEPSAVAHLGSLRVVRRGSRDGGAGAIGAAHLRFRLCLGSGCPFLFKVCALHLPAFALALALLPERERHIRQ
jgi:hypothetical protein